MAFYIGKDKRETGIKERRGNIKFSELLLAVCTFFEILAPTGYQPLLAEWNIQTRALEWVQQVMSHVHFTRMWRGLIAFNLVDRLLFFPNISFALSVPRFLRAIRSPNISRDASNANRYLAFASKKYLNLVHVPENKTRPTTKHFSRQTEAKVAQFGAFSPNLVTLRAGRKKTKSCKVGEEGGTRGYSVCHP